MFETKLNKGKANGYASLNSNLKVPIQNSYVITGGTYTSGTTTLYFNDNTNIVISGYSESVTLPYKVYTALLTQSGGDNYQNITSGNLTIGVTYEINDDSGNPDFTNVGAPNNIGGTYFVATGTTPNSWGNNAASLIYNTGAPVVKVLENTIGNIVWTRLSAGVYDGTLANAFPENKTFVIISTPGRPIIFAFRYDDNIVQIQTTDTSYGSQEWNTSFPQSIEIRVYN